MVSFFLGEKEVGDFPFNLISIWDKQLRYLCFFCAVGIWVSGDYITSCTYCCVMCHISSKVIIINPFWNINHEIDGKELHFTRLTDEKTDIVSENWRDAV